MTKKIKKDLKQNKEIKKKPSIRLKDYQKNLITFGIVFVLLLIVFSPMAFQGMRPGGVDVIGSKGSSHQRIEFQKETGETVYWNPPVFSGMPNYHRIGGKVFSLDSIINKFLGEIIYSIIWIYLIGFIGMFYLLRFLKLGFWEAVFGGLGFIFIPHFMSLLSIGHFAKFRPIMYMPIVTFFFLSFLNKKNLLWFFGFVFAFSVQIRTQHYQIIFYQIMILLFVGLYYLIRVLINKETKRFLLKIILIIGGSLLITAMVAQPLFIMNEYTPHSIRGGTGEEKSTGLDIDYATGWSMHPAELFTFVMPRFFGGTSGEIYNGNKVSQLKGRKIPGYWGHMPFTQVYDYFGVVLIFFSIVGLILSFKKGFIKVLFALFLLSVFLSFGRHLPFLYSLFFQYVPFFNKFRVPSMILVVMQFIMVIWAGFGINRLLKFQDKDRKKFKQIIICITIFMLILALVPWIFGNSFSFEKLGETGNYNHPLYQSARKDMMQTDALRMILFAVLTAAIILFFIHKVIRKYIFIGAVIIILLIDLLPYVKKAEGKLYDPIKLEKQHFKMKQASKEILKDTSYYRVFPITENPFNNNDWSYYHNSIGGYNAAKLRIYQDIVENCIFKGADPQVPVNWNILKMLNTKYIISSSQLPQDHLEPYYYDQQNKLLVYKAKYDPQPAWFVDEVITIEDREKRFDELNDPDFDPSQTAILEEEFLLPVEKPDSSYILTTSSFNTMKYEVYTDKPTLFVASEIYYPPKGGWQAYVDGKEVPIYKTNHVLRSIYIDSPGNHEIVFEFSPQTFLKHYRISLIAHIFAFVCLIAVAAITIIQKRKKE